VKERERDKKTEGEEQRRENREGFHYVSTKLFHASPRELELGHMDPLCEKNPTTFCG